MWNRNPLTTMDIRGAELHAPVHQEDSRARGERLRHLAHASSMARSRDESIRPVIANQHTDPCSHWLWRSFSSASNWRSCLSGGGLTQRTQSARYAFSSGGLSRTQFA